jgi:small subunit ribosomal protein S6e
MKINIANSALGQQKVFDIEDENCLLPFYEKRMGMEVAGDSLGDQFKGYIFRITGGNDKQGFPMKQGILKNQRVRLLFGKGDKCFRERRGGIRKRKSVRGCIVGHDLAIMNLVLVKKGDADIEGLTDGEGAVRRLGPKRATKIKKLFGLEKADDVRPFVVRRKIGEEEEGGKAKNAKAPKIQRLVTKKALQRKRRYRNERIAKVAASREDRRAYIDRCHQYREELKEKRKAEIAKKKGKAAKKVAKK